MKRCDLDEQLSLHRRGGHPVEADDGVRCALLRLGWTVVEDMWTGKSQLVGESVLAHDEFFLRSIGIEIHVVAELETRSVIGMYESSPKVKCREGRCGAFRF